MADTFYFGRRGGGKTLGALVFDVWLDWIMGAQVWTNMRHISPYFDKNTITGKRNNLYLVDAVDLIGLLVKNELSEDVCNSDVPKVLLLDEIKTQASAVNFHSFINRNLANFISQARKRNFKIVYTDQILGAYDKYIRLMTDKVVRCLPITNPNDLGWGTVQYPEPVIFQYYALDLTEDDIDNPNINTLALTRSVARKFYPLYRTQEIITPVELAHPEIFGDNGK